MPSRLPVPENYLAGYLDGAASIQFEHSKGGRAIGYRINPALIISAYDKMSFGMLDECFESLNVNYRVEKRENTWQLMVESRESMEILSSKFRYPTLRNGQGFAFLEEVFWPAEDEQETFTKSGFYQMVVAIERLQPHRRNKSIKYTREYYRDEFGIEAYSLPRLEFPQQSNLPTVTREYFAGLFDGAGRFSPAVNRSEQHTLGYSLGIHARIQRSKIGEESRSAIIHFLDEYGISYTIHQHDDQTGLLYLQITSRKSLRSLLDLISANLVGRFDEAMVVVQEILPRLEADEHLSKEGFIETLAIMDEMVRGQARRGKRRKLTASYFRELWSNEQD